LSATAYVGIDLGVTGAVAILFGSNVILDDVTTTEYARGRRMVDPRWASDLLAALQNPEIRAVFEFVRPWPKNGAITNHGLGMTEGAWRAVLSMLSIPLRVVTPQDWKREYRLTRASKDASRARAIELFPSMRDSLIRKKDHNRAEALLLAEWLRRQG